MGSFRPQPSNPNNAVGRSTYEGFDFDPEVIKDLKRLGLSEQLIAEIIRNPLRTEMDDEGRVVSIQRDNSTGAVLFIHHKRHVDEKPKQGHVRPLNSTVQAVRLEGAPRVGGDIKRP